MGASSQAVAQRCIICFQLVN